MSYKSQLNPLSGTGEKPLRLLIRGSWGSAPADSGDMKFLRSWLAYDSDIQDGLADHSEHSRFLGLALLVAISASFWAGVGLMIARVW
jgi:hypothetical protein